jgi:hypothetical protein
MAKERKEKNDKLLLPAERLLIAPQSSLTVGMLEVKFAQHIKAVGELIEGLRHAAAAAQSPVLTGKLIFRPSKLPTGQGFRGLALAIDNCAGIGGLAELREGWSCFRRMALHLPPGKEFPAGMQSARNAYRHTAQAFGELRLNVVAINEEWPGAQAIRNRVANEGFAQILPDFGNYFGDSENVSTFVP